MQPTEARLAVHLGRLFASDGVLSRSQLASSLPSRYSPQALADCLDSLLACKLVRRRDCRGLTLYWTITSERWHSAAVERIEDLRALLLPLKSPHMASSQIDRATLQTLEDEIRRVNSQIERAEAGELVGSRDRSPSSERAAPIEYSAEELLIVKKLNAEILVIETECSKWAHCAKQCLELLASVYHCTTDELISRMKVSSSVLAFFQNH